MDGKKLGTYSVSWDGSGNPVIGVVTKTGYFKGRTIGVAQDRLGTVRWAASAPAMSYRSYGAETTYTQTGTEMFATYPQVGPGLQYADQRWYNPQVGKFFSPDPGGVSTAKPKNPGSWNRYLYAGGDPVNMYDPAGMFALTAEYCSNFPSDPDCTGYNNGDGCGRMDLLGGTTDPCDVSGGTSDGTDDYDPPPAAPTLVPISFQFVSAVSAKGFNYSTQCAGAPYGAFATETFQVLDQNGNPMGVAGITVQENITNSYTWDGLLPIPTGGSNGWVPTTRPGPTTTSASGQFIDSPFGGCSSDAGTKDTMSQ